jgi:lysophospholipase L1-like esterase
MWGWTEVNLGLGGTGYTTPGPEEKATTYLQRVDTVKEADPDAIVVFGGRNDLVSPIRRIRVAAGALFRELRRLDGSPDVVVVAPLWDASKPPKSFAALTAAIRDAARDAGVDFVPVPQQPLAGRPQLMAPDGLHPNADGYRVIAQFLAPRLKDAITGR